jgi:hypothetical protein
MRREIQLWLLGYLLISISEIFSIGAFPLNAKVRLVSRLVLNELRGPSPPLTTFQAFSAIHIGAIAATTWMLFLNAIVGYQLMDDGTPISVALVGGSALVFLIGVGYIALDTGFSFTGFWESSHQLPNRNIALYVLYLIVPLLWIVLFFVLESILVLRILGEVRPMLFLVGAALAFAAGQVFNFVVSPYICNGTAGKIDGSLFQTLFTLISVVLVWIFWSSITEDDWDMETYGNTYTGNPYTANSYTANAYSNDYTGVPGRRPSSRV